MEGLTDMEFDMAYEWNALREFCPKCRSTELTRTHRGWGWLLLEALLQYLPFSHVSVVCNSCGHRWQAKF